jgi:hypothetical protein
MVRLPLRTKVAIGAAKPRSAPQLLVMEGNVMRRCVYLGLALVMVVCMHVAFAPAPAAAQVVPDTVDPYELAPQNVHLYPISLNARMPFFYLPPIFAPAPMWRGALTTEDVYELAPHNYIAYEIPDSTALVAWGTAKKDIRVVLEAANQQEFMILPPKALDDGSSYFLVKTSMRYVPAKKDQDLQGMFERELILAPSRVQSIAEQLDVRTLTHEYERVEDVADINPRVPPVLQDEVAAAPYPVDRIYASYSGWRRNPNRVRTNGDWVPTWFTIEGKLLALKTYNHGTYFIEVSFEGYNPYFPLETAQNVMRKVLALSFDEYVETTPYYPIEKALNTKEWHRQGSGQMLPYETRKHVGWGSDGQGAY